MTSSLLADKGTAVPTVGRAAEPAMPATRPAPMPATIPAPGVDLPATGTPTRAPDATPFDGPTPKRDKDDRVRVTMRIDPERHFRLRLVAAHLNQSTQDVLSVALDSYLDQVAPAVINRAGIGPAAGEGGQAPHTMYQLNPTDMAGTTEFVTRPRRVPRDREAR